MGMDLSVYRVIRPLAEKDLIEGVRYRHLFLREQQLEQFKQRFGAVDAAPEEVMDVDLLRAEQGIPESWAMSEWDLSAEEGWASFSDPEGKAADKLVTVQSRQYLCWTGRYDIGCYEVEEMGYMRKPFRHSCTPAVASVEASGASVITFTVGNFAGADLDALTAVLGKEAMEDCYAVLLYDDLPQLRQLKDLCAFPEVWEQQVLNDFGPDCCVVIDW